MSHAQTQGKSTPVPDDTEAMRAIAQAAMDRGLIQADPALTQRLDACVVFGVIEEATDAVATAFAGGAAADKALDAIEPLFEPGDVVQITAIPPAGGGALSHSEVLSDPNGRADLAAFIREHNGRRNLYFGVNPLAQGLAGAGRKASAADVVARRTVFVDMDNKDAPGADPDWTRTRAELEALGPDLMVETGNGFHAHYRIEALSGDALAASVTPLSDAQQRLGSDNVADLPRIARLPWTVNLPKDNKRKRGSVPTLAVLVQPNTRPSKARPLADLCADLADVATRLALPGKNPGTGAVSGQTASRSGAKTGWAAPSVELLRLAMAEMPNDGPFNDRDEWMDLAHAVKGAAMAGGMEAEGRVIWLNWCATWREGGDPTHDAEAWDGIKTPHTGWGTVMRLLEAHNPAGHGRVKLAVAQASFPTIPTGFRLQPVRPFNPADIPPRQWLYGRSVIAKNLSLVVAAGGAGKSALAMAEALAMASGKTLLPPDKPHRPLSVWYHNAEDELPEQERRLSAAMIRHGITHADLGGRLHLTGREKLDIEIARQGRDGVEVNRDAVDILVAEMNNRQTNVLILDPLGSVQTLTENSNEAVNSLMRVLREIMDRTGAAIVLVHHTSKAAAKDMDGAGAGASRGASAFVDGARNVRQLRQAGSKDVKLGIPADDLEDYLRVDNGKANLAPAGKARWLRRVSIALGNGTADYPDGDHVQTVEAWEPPQRGATIDPADVQRAYEAVKNAPSTERRASTQSSDWVGYLIAQELGIDIGEHGTRREDLTADQNLDRAQIVAMIQHGRQVGWLVKTEEQDRNRRAAPHIAAGKPPPPAPATPPDSDDADED